MKNAMWKRYKYWIAYTGLFLGVFAVVFSPFVLGGYSFVNRVDGLNQQYSSLLYFHRWGRSIWENFQATGKWEFPVWDINIGLGTDIFTTIFYYVSVPPITLGAILCPESLLEHFYAFEFCFRLYWAGISFLKFARYHGQKDGAALLGSMSYCFCGFVIQKGIQHTFFVMPMIFLPLILLGVDKIYKKQSPAVFIIFTALGAITNFYFFYMIVLAVVLYVAGQFWFAPERGGMRNFLIWIGKFAVYALIAVAIAGVVLLPTAFAMLGSERLGNQSNVPFLYHISYYYQLFWGMGTNEFRDFDSRTGYAATSLLAVFWLLAGKGEKKLKCYFAVLTLFLCIPWVGSVFNGFGYISNRWIFIYSFLISYILTKMASGLDEWKEKETVVMLCMIGIYLFVGNIFPLTGIADGKAVYREGVWVSVLAIFVAGARYFKINHKYVAAVIWLGTVGSIFLNAHYEYSPVQRDAARAYVKRGEVLQEYGQKLSSNLLLDIEDIMRYRSCCVNGENNNSFMLQEIPGTEFYFSVVVDSVNRFFREMYYNQPLEHQYNGFQGRLILESLASTKYFLADKEKNADMLARMSKTELEENKRAVYTNPYALPMAYLYKEYILRSDYDKLSVTDKQEALLYGAVVEACGWGLKQAEPEFSNQEIEYSILPSDSIAIEGGRYWIRKENDTLTLKLDDMPENAELYVIFEGISYEGLRPVELYADGSLKNVDWRNRQIIRDAEVGYQEKDGTAITVTAGELEGSITYYTEGHRMYCGKHDFLCSLGYVEKGADEIALRFSEPGMYTFSDIRVVVQPGETIEKQLSLLQKAGIPDWKIGMNRMEGNVSCQEAGILCVAVPYSKGWKAFVDGVEVPVEPVNTVFMGVELNEGEHEVIFSYRMPMGKEGIIASFMGMIGFAVCSIWHKQGYRHGKRKKTI